MRLVTRGGETVTEEVWIAQIRYVDKFAGESRKVRRAAPTERGARAKLKELQATTFGAAGRCRHIWGFLGNVSPAAIQISLLPIEWHLGS